VAEDGRITGWIESMFGPAMERLAAVEAEPR
jgi:hypothetical protein